MRSERTKRGSRGRSPLACSTWRNVELSEAKWKRRTVAFQRWQKELDLTSRCWEKSILSTSFFEKKKFFFEKMLVLNGLKVYRNFTNLPKIECKCDYDPVFDKFRSKLWQVWNYRVLTNPYPPSVTYRWQKGVLGGGAPWHVTCVEDGNFKDEKRKRTLCAFQR